MGLSLRSNGSEFCGPRVARVGVDSHWDWSFLGGSKVIHRPKLARCDLYQKGSGVYASCNPFSPPLLLNIHSM